MGQNQSDVICSTLFCDAESCCHPTSGAVPSTQSSLLCPLCHSRCPHRHQVANTKMNKSSSRSHSVLQLQVLTFVTCRTRSCNTPVSTGVPSVISFWCTVSAVFGFVLDAALGTGALLDPPTRVVEKQQPATHVPTSLQLWLRLRPRPGLQSLQLRFPSRATLKSQFRDRNLALVGHRAGNTKRGYPPRTAPKPGEIGQTRPKRAPNSTRTGN